MNEADLLRPELLARKNDTPVLWIRADPYQQWIRPVRVEQDEVHNKHKHRKANSEAANRLDSTTWTTVTDKYVRMSCLSVLAHACLCCMLGDVGATVGW